MENNLVRKGYKAYNKGLICRGMQFVEGQEYKTMGNPRACNNGIHYCENPLDVLDYYNLVGSEFTTVEALGEVDTDDNKMFATNKIKIGVKLDLPAFIKASIDFVWEKIKVDGGKDEKTQASSDYNSKLAASGDNSKLAASGYNSKLAASGDYSKLAASGYYSKLAASGYNSKLAASGDYSKLAASGDDSQLAASGDNSKLAASGYKSKLAASGYNSNLAASGDNSQLAASGDNSQLAASGYNSNLAASGDNSKLAASGDNSQLELTGRNSVGAAIGYNNKIKAALNCWITLAEYDNNGIIICVKSAKIDGKIIKADTWYKLENKKFTETEV